jgi:hypothetical protein
MATNVRLLTGATVTVCGSSTASGLPLMAETVELGEVDGMPAHLGLLSRGAEGWALQGLGGETPIQLSSVPADLERGEGQVVWVAGAASENGFTVLSFGVLSGWVRGPRNGRP